MTDDFDSIGEQPSDPEWDEAEAIFKAIMSIHKEYGMGIEVIYHFMRYLRAGDKPLDALWHARNEWDV